MSLVPIEAARQELDAGRVTPVPVDVQLPSNSFVTIYSVGQVEPGLNAIIQIFREIAATLGDGSQHPGSKASRSGG